jgi:glycosyltransferase involved in cell wall biosynthesis
MNFSLLFPVLNENQNNDLHLRLQDLDSFFKKTPFNVELLFVVDPCTDNTITVLESYSPAGTNIKVRILKNTSRLGRAQSILAGVSTAQSELVITCSLDLSAPLSEVYTLAQELIADEKLDLAIGNRMTSRKKRVIKRTQWHQALEDIICEKNRARGFIIQDPLTSMLGFRKERLKDWTLSAQKNSTHWYFALPWVKLANQLSLKWQEVPVLNVDQLPSRIPLLREYLRHLG